MTEKDGLKFYKQAKLVVIVHERFAINKQNNCICLINPDKSNIKGLSTRLNENNKDYPVLKGESIIL